MPTTVSINISPGPFKPAYNQMLYNIESTKTAEPNYNFVADVYVSGFTGIQARLLYPKQPNSIAVWFDIGPVIQNYVSYDFIDSWGQVVSANWRSTAKYYVQLGEIYDVSGVPTLHPDLVRSPSSNYWQGLNPIFDFQQFKINILDDYDVATGHFLNTTVKQYMRSGQKKLLSIYDKTNAINAYRVSTSFGILATEGISPHTAFNIFNFDIHKILSTLSVPAASEYIDFAVGHGDDDFIQSAVYRIYIDNNCSQYDTYRLHWLNQLGGWDTFNFNKATTNAIEVDRKQFKSILPFNYAHSDRLKTNYNTGIVDKINIQSDWVTDDEGGLLQTLTESPIVFLEKSDGTFIAVNITNPSFTPPKYINGRQMLNVSVDMEYSYNRYRQSQ